MPRGQGGSGVTGGEKSGGGLLTCGDGFGSKSRRGVAQSSELRSQGGSRGLGEAAARLKMVWGAARLKGERALCGREASGRRQAAAWAMSEDWLTCGAQVAGG
jgi:hypothetical protein